MKRLKSIALLVPAIRNLHEDRNRLTREVANLVAENAALTGGLNQEGENAKWPERLTRLRNVSGLEQLNIQMFLHQPPDIISECIYQFGHWEASETKFVMETLKPGAITLDLGANIGYYTTLFSRLAGPSGRVISFEPDDDNYRLLTLNIARNNLSNVSPFKAAVSDASGIITLRQHDADNRGAHMAVPVEGPSFNRSSYHPKIALDELLGVGAIDHVDFIKMDTQGSEPLIIKGGRKLIERNRQHLTMVGRILSNLDRNNSRHQANRVLPRSVRAWICRFLYSHGSIENSASWRSRPTHTHGGSG